MLDAVQSFDCQEYTTPDEDSGPPYTPPIVLPAIDAQKTGEVQVLEQHLFPIDSSLDNRTIKKESANNINLTKRLDKIDNATGRIIYTNSNSGN